MPKLGFAWLAATTFAASLGYFLYAYFIAFGAPAPPDARSWPPALFNAGLFTAFAAHHSIFARTPVKSLIQTVVPATLERATYTLVASVLFWLVCCLWLPVSGTAWVLTGPWRWAGFAVQAAGIVLTIAGARALDVWELAGVRQASPGTPAPPVLKTTGLYGFVRHPLYFAWVLLVFGAPEMNLTRLTFALVSTLYLAAAVPYEERSLVETFGEDYASYQRKVRWRILPFLY